MKIARFVEVFRPFFGGLFLCCFHSAKQVDDVFIGFFTRVIHSGPYPHRECPMYDLRPGMQDGYYLIHDHRGMTNAS